METVDAAHMRAINCSILLKLIWKHHRISRADISRMTSMSRSTVSAIVAELMDRGLVSELGIGPSSGGRRPMMLAFQEDAYSILGVQVSAHSISAATLNLNGVVRRWFTQPCDVLQDPAKALELLQRMLDEASGMAFAEQMPLIGMALGYPAGAAVDFKQWEATLRERVKIPVHFATDAYLGAVAELWWNQEAQSQQIGYFQLSEILGFGLLIRQGEHNFGLSGNLGILLLETQNRISSLHSMIGECGTQSLAKIFDSAANGDRAAEAWINAAAEPLALTLYNGQSLLRLDRVILGGLWRQQIARLRFLIEGLEEQFGQLAPGGVAQWLVPGFRGEQQVALGAGARLLERILDDPNLFPAKTTV